VVVGSRRHARDVQASDWPVAAATVTPQVLQRNRITFALSSYGQVFFREAGVDSHWTPLAGSPCGLVWGVPVDIDATTRGIWVVCQKEFMSVHGIRKEHFLFAKWGWCPENNHRWWNMMASGNVSQLDAVKDSIFGVDSQGSIVWRPTGVVIKHSRWHKFDGPPGGVKMWEVIADTDQNGTWLWGRDTLGRVWRRTPDSPYAPMPRRAASSASGRGWRRSATLEESPWSMEDEDGVPLWPPRGPELTSLKNSDGVNWALDADGRLFWRPLQGCCRNGDRGDANVAANESLLPPCWCVDRTAPRLSRISDTGTSAVGLDFPVFFHRNSTWDAWSAATHRWITEITDQEDIGSDQTLEPSLAAEFAGSCSPPAVGFDHCESLRASVGELNEEWRAKAKAVWPTWDWEVLKEEYWLCQQRSHGKSLDSCDVALRRFGSFREEFLQHTFCCARDQLTTDDPECADADCQAYDMVCPGSKMATSDMDCTVYHSRDPASLILKMKHLAVDTLRQVISNPSRATLQTVFDANLYGTWTYIPDTVFKRLTWPAASKALFEEVGGGSTGHDRQPVWVLRKKCTPGARAASLQKFYSVAAGQPFPVVPSLSIDQAHAERLRRFTGSFADGRYASGSLADWERIFEDFWAVASLQEGYLTYPTLLEIVGRQQAGIRVEFREDMECARQVSFVEQATFVAQYARDALPETVEGGELHQVVTEFLQRTGKYFDRMLDVVEASEARHNTLQDVLEAIHGEDRSCGQEHEPNVNQRHDLAPVSDAQARRSSCLDVAMWGVAVRHMEAFKSDAGELGAPLVEAFFPCFVDPGATFKAQGVRMRESVLARLEEWVGAMPPLGAAAASTHAMGTLAVGGVVALLASATAGFARRRRWEAAAPRREPAA